MGLLSAIFKSKTPDDLQPDEVEAFCAVHDDGRIAFVDFSKDSCAHWISLQTESLSLQRVAVRKIGIPMTGTLVFEER